MQENTLQSLFRQLEEKKEKTESSVADLNLKGEVFTTIDATSLIADFLDLFTAKFLESQAEIINALPGSNYGNEKEKLFHYFEKKYRTTKDDEV